MSAEWETYGVRLPGVDLTNLTGRLIVVEGTDGVGRSTQIAKLRPWLEQRGRAVMDTGTARSVLAGKGIKKAKQGNTLGTITSALFYATDFADRLENQIIPALRAGFIVLTDRYIYSLMARAIVRGCSPRWIQSVYSYALKPTAVFYMRIDVETLIPRVIFHTGFDYWEAGMDLHLGSDMYESFCKYQEALLNEFESMAEQYQFRILDATRPVDAVFADLSSGVVEVLEADRARIAEAAKAEAQAEAAKAEAPAEEPAAAVAPAAEPARAAAASTAGDAPSDTEAPAAVAKADSADHVAD